MSADLDRFDRMLLGIAPASPTRATFRTAPARRYRGRYPGQVVEDVAPVARGPRFADHMDCPLCGVERIGITYQGELMSGVKVHEIAVHSPGMRRADREQPRCLGSSMRVEFEGGEWRGVK